MLKLGIVWEDGAAKNHRCLAKVLLNPFLGPFGYQLATNCQLSEVPYGEIVEAVVLQRIPRKPVHEVPSSIFRHLFYFETYDLLEKRRRIF